MRVRTHGNVLRSPPTDTGQRTKACHGLRQCLRRGKIDAAIDAGLGQPADSCRARTGQTDRFKRRIGECDRRRKQRAKSDRCAGLMRGTVVFDDTCRERTCGSHRDLLTENRAHAKLETIQGTGQALSGPAVDQRAQALIARIEAAVARYPWSHSYRLWPGPNSNTFVAYVARQVPELGLDLPPTAIGKDYLGSTTFVAPAPSGSGWQVSLAGLAGVTVAREEGLEINLLGLGFGVDVNDGRLRLPGFGTWP